MRAEKHACRWEPDYELSPNQQQFVSDALEQGLEVNYEYSGRGMYGRRCPAVTVASPSEFRTTAATDWDSLGFGFVVYARG
jgi:hypothetical protein